MSQAGQNDYLKQEEKRLQLQVPPDLSQLKGNNAVRIPTAGVDGVGVSAQEPPLALLAPVHSGDFQLFRDGALTWISTSNDAAKLWPQVAAFWVRLGFTLSSNIPLMSLMETETSLSGEKFRTRLEQVGGKTEIYITSFGETKDSSIGAALEIEYLRKLMLVLGAPDVAKIALQLLPARVSLVKIPKDAAVSATAAGGGGDAEVQVLLIPGSDEEVWRRVGIALDRGNFTQQDRDRSLMLYRVRFSDPQTEPKQPGFWAKLFGAKNIPVEDLFQIKLMAQTAINSPLTTASQSAMQPGSDRSGPAWYLQVLDKKGQIAVGPRAEKILMQLFMDLRGSVAKNTNAATS